MPLGHATTAHRLVQIPVANYHLVSRSATTDILGFLPQLDSLLTAENAHGYTFQASTRAYDNTRGTLETASALLGRAFPIPRFMPDGEGGIDTEWSKGDRNLTLSCRGRENQEDFLYWEEGGQYDGDSASLDLLIEKLGWLNG